MPTLPPKLQTLNGFRVVYPPNPPFQGGLIWFEEKLGLPLSTPLPPYQRVIIWLDRQSSSQTRENGNISHDESQKSSFAVGRPFGRFGKPSGRSSFFGPRISELALRQVLLLCPQDKRTGSPRKRTGSPAGPPSFSTLSSESLMLSSESLISTGP